ncbi:MAG: glycerol-3-phosphate 1-O-acyltransferase PlsY [Verrucomicrobiota bacterium]|jgi:acyl phosphate:glycerol-3-phosphate acyltransferase
MTVTNFIFGGLLSYLLGSIPTGFLWAKARGIDIRTVGSGNIGATNVMRVLGKIPGIAVLLIDAGKGFLPVLLAKKLIPGQGTALQIVCCLAVIAGHNWTCWLKFKGGKGVATSAGALAAMLPVPMLCGLAVWGVVFALSRYVSLASVSAAAALPIATWRITHDLTSLIFTGILGMLVLYTHRTNIHRLLAGTENRVGKKKL